jgi:uncharacterized protein YjdB
MLSARRQLTGLVAAALVIGSCVGGDGPTGISVAEVGIALQPALIPSAADGTALPVTRIRTVVTRHPDGVVLREQRFDVLPTAASWTLEIGVPVTGASVDVVVYLYLLNVAPDGVETVQFSGRTDPLTVNANARLANVDADIVRGPLSNLLVTGVTITSAPNAMFVGDEVSLAASVATSESTTPEIFWTSLDPTVLTMDDSVATALSEGTAEVVASAGAHADTVSIDVVAVTVDSVLVSPDSADVVVGQSRAYTAALYDVGGNVITGPVTWTTGNGSIATVNGSGQVTGVAPGTTTVRATSGGVFDEAVVRVTTAPTGGAVNVWLAGAGTWSTASKWSLGRVPSAADTVHLVQGSQYVVTLDANATIGALVIGAPVTLQITNATLTVTGAGAGPEVDVQALGVLELVDGWLIADEVASAGTVRSDGSLSRVDVNSVTNQGNWHVQTGLQSLGNDGVSIQTSGSINLDNNSVLTLGTNGSVTYQGGTIGGTGVMLLNQGTSLTLGDDLSIDGPHLQLSDGSIYVEDSESLTIGPTSSLQMVATTTTVEIGVNQLFVQGSLSIVATDIYATGTIDIADGGSVLVQDNGVSSRFTTGTVQNAGVLAFAGSSVRRFGPGASGQITNTATGVIQTIPGGTTVLDGELSNQGYIFVAGPTDLVRESSGVPSVAQHVNDIGAAIELVPGGSLDIYLGGIGAAPSSFTNSGTITVYDGAALYLENMSDPAAQIIATGGALFEGTGTVDLRGGPPALPPLAGFNDGTIAPGHSGPGILTWFGTVPMGPTGIIEIEIDGPAAGTGFDQLNVSAQLFLNGNGTLDMSGSTYSAFFGDRFPIISYGTRVGDFARVVFPNISGVTFDTLTVVTPDTPVPVADTLVVYVSDGPSRADNYWRFEGTAFLQDSDGDVGLTAGGTTTPQQVTLPTAGRGSFFPDPVAQGSNASAADLSGSADGGRFTASLAATPQFTIEAFVHFDVLSGTYGDVIAGIGVSNSGPWFLEVRFDGFSGTSARELVLSGTAVTGGSWLAGSDIILSTGIDYYVAAAFDLTGSVTFWVQDLTNAGPLMTATATHGLSALLSDSRFTIGDTYDSSFDFEMDGLVDEVRLSSRVLAESELLINTLP